MPIGSRTRAIAAGIVFVMFLGTGTLLAQDATSAHDAPAPQDAPLDAQKPADTESRVLEKPVLSNPELLKKYVWATLGAEGAIGATSTSGFMQWLEYPPEWTGEAGYGKRWASAYGETAVAETTKYAVARLLHHDPSFTPCRCSGLGPRLRYALTAPFTARRRDGRRVPSPAIFVGLMTGQVVSRTTWYPAGYGIGNGLETTATGLLSKIGLSIWKEFRPRRRSLFNLNALKP